jgi:hypothetical protein
MQVTEKTCQKTRVGEVRQEAKLRYESRRAQARKLWRLVEVETASKIMGIKYKREHRWKPEKSSRS